MTKLSIEFDAEELKKINTIRKKTGIKQITEVVRYLITKEVNSAESAEAKS